MKRNEKAVRETSKVWRAARKKSRKCIVDGCNNMAINSHILQRNGIISLLCEDRHFYMMEMKDFFQLQSPFEMPFQFKRIGINAGLSFPIFCSEHDTNLFSDIETGSYDPFSYKAQLLFSYRSICKEIRKKEIQIDTFGSLVNNSVIRGEYRPEKLQMLTDMLTGYILGVKDLNFYKSELEEELKNVDTLEAKRFTFKTIETQRLDVCTSTVFSPTDYATVQANQEKELNTMMISVFPKGDKTIVICGYHNLHFDKWMEQYLNSWESLTDEEIQQKISTLIVKRCETWGMSPSLYEKLGEEKREAILNAFYVDAMSHDRDMSTDINVFKN